MSLQEEVGCGPLTHSVSVGVDMDAEDSDNSLDMADLVKMGSQNSHSTEDMPYIGHQSEDTICYSTLPPDGGCASLANTYASCSSGAYLSAPASISCSSAASLEQCTQFSSNLPCEASGKGLHNYDTR